MEKITRESLILCKASELMAASPDAKTFPPAGMFFVENRFPKHDQVYQPQIALQIHVIEGVANIQWWNHGGNKFERADVKAGESVSIPRNEYFAIGGPAIVSLISSNKQSFVLQKGHID